MQAEPQSGNASGFCSCKPLFVGLRPVLLVSRAEHLAPGAVQITAGALKGGAPAQA
jgi:hypothetical protein